MDEKNPQDLTADELLKELDTYLFLSLVDGEKISQMTEVEYSPKMAAVIKKMAKEGYQLLRDELRRRLKLLENN
ncbi:MAG: hypothetical protein EXS55_02240 [Candidatus Magasanikbacteria bacterium]|nr:hypothetical protein [Candidatus Magasanikbacteria bacterium]